MEVTIRQEELRDHARVYDVVQGAFAKAEFTDHKEHHLVGRLRKSESFIPQLSLVAEAEGQIVGHILLTRISIKNDKTSHESLALAPVSVLPKYQGKGIGGMLIREAHDIATFLGYGSVVLVGHENYYPRFGYLPAHTFGIRVPFEVPLPNCMAIELRLNALAEVSGMVEYDKAFFETSEE